MRQRFQVTSTVLANTKWIVPHNSRIPFANDSRVVHNIPDHVRHLYGSDVPLDVLDVGMIRFVSSSPVARIAANVVAATRHVVAASRMQ